MGKRIIIAGGGTGGHIFPAIAIANAIKKIAPDSEILFVGAKGKMEMQKIPEEGYKIEGLDIAGFNRSSLIKNIGLPWKLIKSFFQVRRIFNQFRPDGVIGVGGYSSFPVLRFAQHRKIPTFVHESNSFAGKSNIMLGKMATKVFVASGQMDKFFPQNKIVKSGNPVRPVITQVETISKKDALHFFGLTDDRKTVLIVGGSLGARSINEAIEAGLPELIRNNIQVIWQTGKLYAAKARERAANQPTIWVNEFISKMEMAYAAADLVVSRAGAIAKAELCVAKKPVLFVPYPFAAEDHQTVNAMDLVSKNAAIMVKDKEANEKLVAEIIDLAKDQNRQEELKKNIAQHAVYNADMLVAKEILNSLKNINE
ncbi:MAG: undecaprenyldiphospho-muramoylpentapeptide beta-N-acetylglucosaminyltransferase [Flavisolibacter sp.]